MQCPKCAADVPDGTDQCTACGQTLCSECGAAVTPDATRCAACGAEFVFVCPECGYALGPTDVKCPQCGTEFQLTCPNCNAEVAPEDAVCPQCGLDFETYGGLAAESAGDTALGDAPRLTDAPPDGTHCPHCGQRTSVGPSA